MKLSVILVNYNTEKELAECVTSLRQQTLNDFEIVVVDNSDTIIANDIWLQGVKLIKPGANIGFGRANNLAVSQVSSEYILFLNPDCMLEDPNTLANMLIEFVKDDNVGILAPSIVENKSIIKPEYKYPKQKYLPDNYFAELPGDICWVLGAVMMVKRDTFNSINGFDKDFFLYAEETDLCLRYRKNGYSIKYSESVKVNHIGGASEISADNYAKTMRKQRGLHLFLYKHYPAAIFKKILFSEMISSGVKMILAKLKVLFSNKLSATDNFKRYKAIFDSSRQSLKDVDWLYFK